MKRSNAPVYWSLFGAGGMLAALAGPALVFLIGIALPLGWIFPSDAALYACALSLAKGIVGKAFLFAVISLFLWHAAHRIYHTLHDFGIRTGAVAWILCYGVALAATVASLIELLRIGF